MSSISNVFKNGKTVVAFITGGYPDMETTEKLIIAMAESGVDIIEIGIPFSDPIAEDVMLQEADEQALATGCTVDQLFEMVEKVSAHVEIPLLFMTYMNPIFAYGKERFVQRCQSCGIAGLIVPDLPFDEKDELSVICTNYNIPQIAMIAPTSNARIEAITKEAEGFIYCMSSGQHILEMVNQIKAISAIPCAVELGISTPEQIKAIATISDGIIIDRAIVKLIAEYGTASVEPVKQFVNQIKHAIEG